MPERTTSGAAAPSRSAVVRVLAIGAGTGALLLAIAQFMVLFHTHVQARHNAVASATVGSEHAWALLPLAVFALLLAYGIWSVASRPALLAIGVLGLVSLLIALLRDLNYAQRQGLRTLNGHYVLAVNQPAIGLYAETLAAAILLVTCVSGFILIGPPARRRVEMRRPDGAPSRP